MVEEMCIGPLRVIRPVDATLSVVESISSIARLVDEVIEGAVGKPPIHECRTSPGSNGER